MHFQINYTIVRDYLQNWQQLVPTAFFVVYNMFFFGTEGKSEGKDNYVHQQNLFFHK